MTLADVLAHRFDSREKGRNAAQALSRVHLSIQLKENSVIPYPLFSNLPRTPALYKGEAFDRVRFRALTFPAFVATGHEIASRYFSKKDKIVEIEADVPEKRSRKTFALSLLPSELEKVPTNPLKEIVEESQHLDPNFKQLDVNHLEDEDADHYIALHLLDKYPLESWHKILTSIMNSLSPGGTFVHFLEILPIERVMCWDLLKKDTIVLPHYLFDGHFDGAIVIPNYSKNKSKILISLHKDERCFLEDYAKLSKIEKEQAFYQSKDKFPFDISEWAKRSLPQDCYQLVSLTDHFKAKLSGLSIPKTKIVFNGVIENRHTYDSSQIVNLNPSNYIINNQGNISEYPIHVLPPGKTMIVNRVAVFVIKKTK